MKTKKSKEKKQAKWTRVSRVSVDSHRDLEHLTDLEHRFLGDLLEKAGFSIGIGGGEGTFVIEFENVSVVVEEKA